MVVLALQTREVINIIPSTNYFQKINSVVMQVPSLQEFLQVSFFSLCYTCFDCITFDCCSKGNLAWGIMLLLFYSIGHGLLSVIAGTSVGLVQKITSSSKYGVFSAIVKIVMGLIILGIGLYMIYLFL